MMNHNFINKQVEEIYNHYPNDAKLKLLKLRALILSSAKNLNPNIIIEETLKWGEPSYLCKTGSTIRLAWHKATPKQVGVYFNCKSLMIETIKEIYPHDFNFEGNRALVFNLEEELPDSALKHCFSLALNYHKIKHLPLLGA